MSPDLGLVYYPDSQPGIRRERRGRGFSYIAPDGTRIDNTDERARIAALAVPPAYEDVWICPRANGHLQATGRDARQRKQYRYHDDWTAWRARKKFDGLAEFGRVLPDIRRRVERDLKKEAGSEELAVATIVALIDRMSLRVGNASYLEENGTYGATTLRRRHAKLDHGHISLAYRAKGGQPVQKRLYHKSLHRALERIGDLPGGPLVAWSDQRGALREVCSEQVNAFLSECTGRSHTTAKTFRTWNGTLAAFRAACRELQGGAAPTIKHLAEAAAEQLHNTTTVARNSYIHPSVIDLADWPAGEKFEPRAPKDLPERGLRSAEAELIGYLE